MHHLISTENLSVYYVARKGYVEFLVKQLKECGCSKKFRLQSNWALYKQEYSYKDAILDFHRLFSEIYQFMCDSEDRNVYIFSTLTETLSERISEGEFDRLLSCPELKELMDAVDEVIYNIT